jgi:hypothetical protein
MIDVQLELSLSRGQVHRTENGQLREGSRTARWFDEMRKVVERILDRNGSRHSRPEQIWFHEIHRKPTSSLN